MVENDGGEEVAVGVVANDFGNTCVSVPTDVTDWTLRATILDRPEICPGGTSAPVDVFAQTRGTPTPTASDQCAVDPSVCDVEFGAAPFRCTDQWPQKSLKKADFSGLCGAAPLKTREL